MTTLDIRKIPDGNISNIQYDASDNRLVSSVYLMLKTNNANIILCSFDELDNFILACQKAKELWHKTD